VSPTLSRDGIAFSYVDDGSGEPLVLQHGLGGDAAAVRPLWSGAGRLLCLECRGHGATTPLGPADDLGFATFARDVAALLEALGLDDVVLAGLSMGAGVALRVAAEQPERVRGLVLVRPAWFTASSPENLEAFPLIAELLRTEGPERGRATFQASAVYRRIRAESPVAAESVLAQFDRENAVERAPVLERLPADRPLAEPLPLSMPIVILATDRDPIHPLGIAEAWADALPSATLHQVTSKTVDEARHEAEVAAAIDGFRGQTR